MLTTGTDEPRKRSDDEAEHDETDHRCCSCLFRLPTVSSYPDTTVDHTQTDVWERASSLPSLLTVTLAAGRRANVADAQACQGRPEQHRNLARRADVGLAVVVENSADTP